MGNLTIRTILACLIMTGVSHGQAKPPGIGVEVVTKYVKPLKVDDRVVDDGREFRVYTVEKSNGDNLWIVSEGVKGWVAASDVVPFSEAIQFYSDEIRKKPESPTAYKWRGLIYWRSGKFDEALRDCDEAIRLDPSDPTSYFDRGTTLFEKKEYDRAITDFDRTIQINPDESKAYSNRAAAWYLKKDYDRTITDCDQAIRLDRKDSRL